MSRRRVGGLPPVHGLHVSLLLLVGARRRCVRVVRLLIIILLLLFGLVDLWSEPAFLGRYKTTLYSDNRWLELRLRQRSLLSVPVSEGYLVPCLPFLYNSLWWHVLLRRRVGVIQSMSVTLFVVNCMPLTCSFQREKRWRHRFVSDDKSLWRVWLFS